jgi:hypothetical protein
VVAPSDDLDYVGASDTGETVYGEMDAPFEVEVSHNLRDFESRDILREAGYEPVADR